MPLPPSWFNEEPAEQHHKYYRYYREHHAPQTTLEANMLAVFLRCIQIADPKNLELIAKNAPKAKKTPLSDKVKALLILPPEYMEIDEDIAFVIHANHPANDAGDNAGNNAAQSDSDSSSDEEDDDFDTSEDDE